MNSVSTTRRRVLSFSLRQLLLATTAIAVACYALRWASPYWSNLLFYFTLALILGGALVAINRPGRWRSFWSGFVLCGVVHWLLIYHPGLENGIPDLGPDGFLTQRVSAHAYYQLKPVLRVQPKLVARQELDELGGTYGRVDPPFPDFPPAYLAGADGHFYSTGPGQFSIIKQDFVTVANGLWTLWLGWLGGWASLWLYRQNTTDSTTGRSSTSGAN